MPHLHHCSKLWLCTCRKPQNPPQNLTFTFKYQKWRRKKKKKRGTNLRERPYRSPEHKDRIAPRDCPRSKASPWPEKEGRTSSPGSQTLSNASCLPATRALLGPEGLQAPPKPKRESQGEGINGVNEFPHPLNFCLSDAVTSMSSAMSSPSFVRQVTSIPLPFKKGRRGWSCRWLARLWRFCHCFSCGKRGRRSDLWMDLETERARAERKRNLEIY